MFARFAAARFSWKMLASMMLLAGLACKSSHRPVIAVIPETTAEEISESEHAGVENAARSLGWNVYWNAPSREDDVLRQIQIVSNAIERGVTGLILSPDHAVALISPVRAALARRIPTVIVGSPLGVSSSAYLAFVLNDDAATGRLAAQRAGRYLRAGDTVAILGVNPNILGSIDRTNAFESLLHQQFPGVNVLEKRSTSFSFAEAEETAEETIRSTPDLHVILALNIIQTRAAYAALLGTQSMGHVKLIGCDQDLDLVYHLRHGRIDALIAENTFVMGVDAVQIIHKLLRGERSASRTVVQPVLIIRENVDSDIIQQVLDMNWRQQ